MNLSEIFAKSQGQPIQLQGQVVHPMYTRPVRPDEELKLTIVSARDKPIQGVRIKVKRGKIQIAEHGPLEDIVLWSDSAPRPVVFRFLSKNPSELDIWNCWRDEQNVMQAWIGNTGLIIQDNGKGVTRLKCNSAYELTFEDLVFDLEGTSKG